MVCDADERKQRSLVVRAAKGRFVRVAGVEASRSECLLCNIKAFEQSKTAPCSAGPSVMQVFDHLFGRRHALQIEPLKLIDRRSSVLCERVDIDLAM